MLLQRLGAFFWEIFQVTIFAVTIFLFVWFLILQPHKIKGESMLPNFLDGEYLLTEKVTYRFEKPKRGDVVVFIPPTNPDDEYIKRVIGLPGDTVGLQDGKFYINGKLLPEDYLPSSQYTTPGNFLSEGKEIIVPEGEYFVVGDNRPNSSDSRVWGPVKLGKIHGKAFFVYWPVVKAGKVEAVSY